MKLTLAMLRAVYAMLLVVPPFSRWGLPVASDVRFSLRLELGTSEDTIAHYSTTLSGKHEISFDQRLHWTMPKLVAIMAHEMCHLKQELIGRRPDKDDQHNAAFKHLAAQACKHLGFDGTDF